MVFFSCKNQHICDADHVSEPNDVMAASLCSGGNCAPVSFGSVSRASIGGKIQATSCATLEGPSPPTTPVSPPPTPVVTPAPTPAPTPLPTLQPVPLPTAIPTLQPVTPPVPQSTPVPTPRPTASPVAPPPTASPPTPSPTAGPTLAPVDLPADTVLVADFSNSEEGFVYADDLFRGTNAAGYAEGIHSTADGGYLEVTLGGVDNADIDNMSGGWSTSFELPVSSYVQVVLDFELGQTSEYESNEISQALCSVDGQILGNYVGEIRGNGNGGGDEVVRDTVTLFSESLSAGTHTIAIGGWNNRKTYFNEFTWARFFSIEIVSTDQAPEVPSCVDSSEFTFFVNGQLVGCDWIGQQSAFVVSFVCGYSFINQECVGTCGQCP